ncbi:DoxX family protein [Microcella humidisoli]|uniref:DoxX family protein n=1 Tax=Microcella humidisoli TaxID=2963406 RepID=A0ABY5FTC5_9MICO|nr:DoxX family protein [Microcella humidisoli]UTT61542.1 DoxX family protein [Microcella humidisoli]
MTTEPATTVPRTTESRPATQLDIVRSDVARRVLAVLRLATGFIFLWAFLDKTFGLGYSTPAERAWVNGGTPSQGFLLGDAVVGPLKPFFAAIASPASDVLFMLAVFGIGLAVMLGIGLRVSAVIGSFVLLAMYLAEWPIGMDAGSTNPIVNYHVIYALSLTVIAVTHAGDTWGAGLPWKRLALVRQARWLI